MPDPFEFFELPPDLPERRAHARQPVRAIAYVQLDESNGGIILNISEDGFAVYAIASLMDDHLPHIRFQLPQSNAWIEAGGNILWRSESNRLAGIRFSGIADQARAQIREWCNSQAALPISPEVPDAPEEAIAHPEVRREARHEEASPATDSVAVLDTAALVLELEASLSASLSAMAGLPESQLSNEPDQDSSALENPSAIPPRPNRLEVVPAATSDELDPADPPAILSIDDLRERASSYPACPDEGRAPADTGLPTSSSAGRAPRGAALPKIVRGPAVSRFARLQSMESGDLAEPGLPAVVDLSSVAGSDIRSHGLYREAPQAARKQQPISPSWERDRWIGILALCLVLSLAAAWEARHGTLHLFSARNSSAISKDLAKPAPQQDSSLSPAANPAAKPQGGKVAIPAGAANAGEQQVTPGAAGNLHTARNNAHAEYGLVVLSPPLRSHRVSNIQIPAAPDLRSPNDQASARNLGIVESAPPLSALIASSNLNPPPPPALSAQPRLGALIYHVAPSYPSVARAARIEGDVTLRATIGPNGKVARVQALSGPPALIAAAVDAVSQWRYKPALLRGQPVATQEDVTIEFRLPPAR
ncbi:MAG: TonB family protein [Candidatus Acidiferrales bacterium]